MVCPRCQGALKSRTYEGLTVDQCSGCSGIWLDQGELAPILAERGEAFSADFKARALSTQGRHTSEGEKASIEPCPKCGAHMEPMNFGGSSGITIDVCSQHGLWFDQGELEQVQAVHEFWQDKLKDPVFRQSITSKLKAEEADVAEQASLQDVANHGFVGRLLKKIFS